MLLWHAGVRAISSKLGLEPTTGRYDQLDRAIRDNSAGRVAANGRAQWQVKMTIL